MKKIAVAGSEAFVLGFQLAGIRDAFLLDNNPYNALINFKGSDFGIVVVEEKFLGMMSSEDRVDIEDCVRPVFIPLSESESQDSMARLIRKSIGIDLTAKN